MAAPGSRLLGHQHRRVSDPFLLIGIGVGVFLLAGVAQAVSGFGSALVAVPLLALVTDPVSAVVAATTVGLSLAGFAVVEERAFVDRAVTWQLLLAGAAGMPLGLWLLTALSEQALTVLMAASVLVALALIVFRVQIRGGRPVTVASGAVSGVLLTSTGMNGPPLVLGLHLLDLAPQRFRATLQAVFCGHDALAVIGFVVVGTFSPDAAWLALGGVLGSVAGWKLGDLLFHRLTPAMFRRVLVVGLLASATSLLITALT